MSNKTNKVVTKNSCERLKKGSTINSCLKNVGKPNSSKKVVLPKKTQSEAPKDNKNCSSCHKKPPVVKPKKTTKSELCFSRKVVLKTSLDYCKKCGDTASTVPTGCGLSDDIKTYIENIPDQATPSKTVTPCRSIEKSERICIRSENIQDVQQYYKNENFRTSESAFEMEYAPRKISSLDTITEMPEKLTEELTSTSRDTIFRIFSDPENDNISLDFEDAESIKKLKEFRKNNYFECHSARSRIKQNIQATVLKDHKCVYRFYLNDRLFPVPLYTDHHSQIRCVECHLPLEFDKESNQNNSKAFINGTIQAKVKLDSGETINDMILMLPVKSPLIIKERRKERQKEIEPEVAYFGVVKLSSTGHSIFNKNLPSDSLALKYQKGYQEFKHIDELKYDRVDEGDVIYI